MAILNTQDFAQFPPTHWSLISRAGTADGESRRGALEELLKRYWQPMRVFVQFQMRIDGGRADDMVQGFIASRILEQNLLAGADPQRGRFRGFLMVALGRFVCNQLRDEKAKKRSPKGQVSIDLVPELTDGSSPVGREFELAWAKQVLADAARIMKEECLKHRREDLWSVFEGRVLGPALEGAEPVSYHDLIQRHAFTSPAQACNALATAKRQFNRCLRTVIGEYEVQESDIDAELEDLRKIIFGSAESSSNA